MIAKRNLPSNFLLTRRPVIFSVVALVGVAIWGGAAVANAADRDSVADHFSIALTGPEPAPDELQLSQLGHNGLTKDSIQGLGTFQNHELYLATDTVGNVCLVAFQSTTKASASSCSAPATLVEHPIGVGLWTSQGGGIEAYLIPDAYEVATLPRGWAAVAPNVIAIDLATPNPENVEVTNGQGASIELHRQGDPKAVTG